MRCFHCILQLVLSVVVACTVLSGADRPNIVLLMADELGYETVGCYGGTSYPTPNIDQLAKEWMRFDRAYAMPLCTNTLIQLMTGKYNLRNWNFIHGPARKTRNFKLRAIVLRRQRNTNDFFVVSSKHAFVCECRMGPDDTSTKRFAGRLQYMETPKLFVFFST
jgi:hypothetical protein